MIRGRGSRLAQQGKLITGFIELTGIQIFDHHPFNAVYQRLWVIYK